MSFSLSLSLGRGGVLQFVGYFTCSIAVLYRSSEWILPSIFRGLVRKESHSLPQIFDEDEGACSANFLQLKFDESQKRGKSFLFFNCGLITS